MNQFFVENLRKPEDLSKKHRSLSKNYCNKLTPANTGLNIPLQISKLLITKNKSSLPPPFILNNQHNQKSKLKRFHTAYNKTFNNKLNSTRLINDYFNADFNTIPKNRNNENILIHKNIKSSKVLFIYF